MVKDFHYMVKIKLSYSFLNQALIAVYTNNPDKIREYSLNRGRSTSKSLYFMNKNLLRDKWSYLTDECRINVFNHSRIITLYKHK